MGHVPITTVTGRQITCRFDREQFVSIETRRTAPRGMDMGGMSGGPLLLPLGTEEGEWHFCLGGVICEAISGTDFETVVAVRAHFIKSRWLDQPHLAALAVTLSLPPDVVDDWLNFGRSMAERSIRFLSLAASNLDTSTRSATRRNRLGLAAK
jgi:hypothetical protein